jgi:hypothetical protein
VPDEFAGEEPMHCCTIPSRVFPEYPAFSVYSMYLPDASENLSFVRGMVSYATRLPLPLVTVLPAVYHPEYVFWNVLSEPYPWNSTVYPALDPPAAAEEVAAEELAASAAV